MEQLRSHIRTLPLSQHRHPAEVTFPGSDATATNRSDNLAATCDRHEERHSGQTLMDGLGGKNGVVECFASVEISI
jgi:hypothetical protein